MSGCITLRGDQALITPRPLSGVLRVAPSKSETHRALVLAARSGSPVRVYNPLSAQDTHSTRDAVCALGAVVEEASDHWLVHAKRLGPPDRAMDCGNSGTTLRLMTAQAAMMPATIDLVGDSSLSRRPNQPLLDALRALGAEVESTQGRAPIRVRGPLRGGDVSLPGRLSSQFASALVLALPFAEFGSVVTVESPVHSRPYLDLTIAMAQQAGLSVVLSEFAGGDLQLAIPGQQSVSASSLTVGADWSTAALVMAAALLSGGSVRLVGLDPKSAQGDRRILDHLAGFGASITHHTDGSIELAGTELCSPGRIDVSQTPDLFPPLCAIAATAKGQTLLQGSSGLRHKECDRIAAMARGLRAAGIECKERSDALLITGGRPRAADYSAEGDHRVHMALCALALAADEPSTVDGAWSTVISYPGFHTDLGSL